jgi:hypothetical protein
MSRQLSENDAGGMPLRWGLLVSGYLRYLREPRQGVVFFEKWWLIGSK